MHAGTHRHLWHSILTSLQTGPARLIMYHEAQFMHKLWTGRAGAAAAQETPCKGCSRF